MLLPQGWFGQSSIFRIMPPGIRILLNRRLERGNEPSIGIGKLPIHWKQLQMFLRPVSNRLGDTRSSDISLLCGVGSNDERNRQATTLAKIVPDQRVFHGRFTPTPTRPTFARARRND